MGRRTQRAFVFGAATSAAVVLALVVSCTHGNYDGSYQGLDGGQDGGAGTVAIERVVQPDRSEKVATPNGVFDVTIAAGTFSSPATITIFTLAELKLDIGLVVPVYEVRSTQQPNKPILVSLNGNAQPGGLGTPLNDRVVVPAIKSGTSFSALPMVGASNGTQTGSYWGLSKTRPSARSRSRRWRRGRRRVSWRRLCGGGLRRAARGVSLMTERREVSAGGPRGERRRERAHRPRLRRRARRDGRPVHGDGAPRGRGPRITAREERREDPCRRGGHDRDADRPRADESPRSRRGAPGSQAREQASSSDGAGDETFESAGYTTFGFVLDGGMLVGGTPGAKFYLGAQAWMDFAPKLVTGPDTRVPLPANAYKEPGRGITLIDGPQFYVGPTLGIQFGH